MKLEIRWLVRLALDQNLLQMEQCRSIYAAVGPEAELMAFAQKIIDDGLITDVELLEKIAGVARNKAQKNTPIDDPLDATVTSERFTETPLNSVDTTTHKSTTRVPAPDFDFETLAQHDEPSLTAALHNLLRSAAAYGASDLHFSTGARPFLRKNRAFSFLGEHTLTAPEALRLNTALLSSAQKKIYLERKDYDYALALGSTDRYRVNLMFHKKGSAGSYRMVPEKIRSLKDLGFAQHEETLKKLLSYHNGLILITGPVGSGKTTTLASMVDYLNTTRTDHIITVEDPIEVVQLAKGCNVSQREVGSHTQSFFSALKGALREDPDIIVIGELRDLETIEMAVSAAETGHLVIGTMHTSDAPTTLTRLLDVFPPSQQTQIRSSVAESLRGIVCQRLLPAAKTGELVLACEILINNVAVSNLIREGKSQGIRNTMETGLKDGMCLMDNVVFQLHQERAIEAPTALANISNRVLRAKIS
jgi:twitching motility protein PilT